MSFPDEKLLSLPITHLVQAQIRGDVSAVEIVQCYLRRAEHIHAATNCFTCWVPEALDDARHCDEYLEETGKTLGRLHGIPCTIKDHYAMKGLPVTMGLKTMRDRMAESGGARHDAVAVLALRAEGAIPIAKTNMTQHGDTWGGGNPAYGDTLNPWNTLRTTGGSSSGEGASVGASASVFGIGSDVGGSVRCPAAFCGVAGLKPTAQRFSFAWDDGRTILNKPGDYGVLATGGPLAKQVADLTEILKACWAKDSPMLNIDTRMPPIPFDEEVMASTRPLTIGYHVGGGYTQPAPCPSTVRCVERVIQALTEAGHNLVPFDPAQVVSWAELHPVLLAEYGVGKRRDSKEKVRSAPKTEREGSYSSKSTDTTVDEVHPDLAAMALTAQGPGELLPVVTSAGEYHAIIAARDRQRDLLSRHWRNAKLDVLICPAWAFPAPPVEEVRHLSQAVWTTQAWNYFDVPAGVLPIGRVTASDLETDWDIALNPPSVDASFRDACLRSREGSQGMPIALQVVGQPWREETVLRAMLEVERVVKNV
ncbi:MAG: amidase family protein, partial [Proteobacteria bacterium]|nr:amidase family protein [Pseudomonadota bacterium]